MSSKLFTLEADNIEQILLRVNFPVLKPDVWIEGDNRIYYKYKRYMVKPIVTIVRHTITRLTFTVNSNSSNNSYRDDNSLLRVYYTLCTKYNLLMSKYCHRFEPILNMLYTNLAICWCEAYIRDVFEPNLFMLRFPKPQDTKYYRDVCSKQMDSLLSYSQQVMSSPINLMIDLPPDYYTSVKLLTASRDSNYQNNKQKSKWLSVKSLLSKAMLQLKSDANLKLLCHKYSILCVDYDRETIINMLCRALKTR